jgi:hypothetical protein
MTLQANRIQGKVLHGVSVWVVRYAAAGPALDAAHAASDAAPVPLAANGAMLSGLLAMPVLTGAPPPPTHTHTDTQTCRYHRPRSRVLDGFCPAAACFH